MEWNEWNGMEWNGMEWNGMEWNGMEWNGMEWNGMEWNGMEWNGMEWNGMEWNGMEWNGMEWNGMEWNGVIVKYDLIGTYLPNKYFRYKKVDDEYHIYFPDDSSMKGLFFIVLKRDVHVETDGLKIQINNKTTTFVLDMEKKIASIGTNG